MGFFDDVETTSTSATPVSHQSASPSTGVSLDKVAASAPGLVSLAKQARVSLEKRGLGSIKAAVYLVLDHSFSMRSFYSSGTMQRFSEQILALSTGLDDDGVVPVMMFDSFAYSPVPVSLDNYAGAIDRINASLGRMSSTSYDRAIEAIVAYHKQADPVHPGLVIFQTDGSPDNQAATKRALIAASHEPLFFSFVGFGHDRFEFLQKLDDLPGRAVDNAGFFRAGNGSVDAATLYDELLKDFPGWLSEARAKHII